ncbi:MAG: hypothetical protein NC131_06105 [Roseburia sp.]|nr:hypothetical protein [Roseburia sp.]
MQTSRIMLEECLNKSIGIFNKEFTTLQTFNFRNPLRILSNGREIVGIINHQGRLMVKVTTESSTVIGLYSLGNFDSDTLTLILNEALDTILNLQKY